MVPWCTPSGLILGDSPWVSDDPLGEAKIGNVDLYTDRVFKKCPELAPLIQRMMSVQPVDRHPSLGPVHQEMLAISRRAKGTSKRRHLFQMVEEAESRPFNEPAEIPEAIEVDSKPERSTPQALPDEELNVVAPDVENNVPEAIIEPDTTPVNDGGEDTQDLPIAPDASAVFEMDAQPADSPLDAPPSPGTTQVGKPVPLTFQKPPMEVVPKQWCQIQMPAHRLKRTKMTRMTKKNQRCCIPRAWSS